MKKILLTAAFILAVVVCGHAENRTFVREYYYQAGESDSKITSRTKALTEVKRLLLEEIGVYLESYISQRSRGQPQHAADRGQHLHQG